MTNNSVTKKRALPCRAIMFSTGAQEVQTLLRTIPTYFPHCRLWDKGDKWLHKGPDRTLLSWIQVQTGRTVFRPNPALWRKRSISPVSPVSPVCAAAVFKPPPPPLKNPQPSLVKKAETSPTFGHRSLCPAAAASLVFESSNTNSVNHKT